MKKIIFLILILFSISYSQTRFLSYVGTTTTAVDTLNFDFYCWEISVMNDGLVTDTLWFWTETNPTSNRKIPLLGGEYITMRFPSSINRLYLQSNGSVKRRVIAKP